MEQSEEVNKLAEAKALFQAEIEGAHKNSKNPFFKKDGKESKYADYESVWSAIQEPLTKNGLSISQGPKTYVHFHEGSYHYFSTLVTVLRHTSGQWESSEWPLKPKEENNPQALMGAVTYARRGALAAITGCPSLDDDGNTAAGLGATHSSDFKKVIPETPKSIRDRVNSAIRFVREASGYEIINKDAFEIEVQHFTETEKNNTDQKVVSAFLSKSPSLRLKPATGGRMS